MTDSLAEIAYYADNRDTTTTVQYNLFYRNSAIGYGGAVQVNGITLPNFTNNTVVNNKCTDASGRGGGLCTVTFGERGSRGEAGYIRGANNIIYNNSASVEPQCGAYKVNNQGGFSLTYTCCSQNIPGTGNITDDPRFVDASNDDYSLMSTSPCIDKGDPGSPKDPDNTRADMGALYFHQGTFINSGYSNLTKNVLRVNTLYYQGNLTISFTINNPGNVTFTLLNPAGQRIVRFDASASVKGANRIAIPMARYARGQYILNIRGADFEQIQKVIIAHR